MRLSTKLEVKQSLGRGLGVFATYPILQNEVFEITPLLDLGVDYESEVLYDYRFMYPKEGDNQTYVVALGYGSLYNHSDQNNADWRECGDMLFEFYALKNIRAGEEIYLCYGGPEYFEASQKNWI